jgi:hypothetical protein
MATIFGLYPFLRKLYADGGYSGTIFQKGLKRVMANLTIAIIKRSDATKGFVVQPKRWIVERSIACLNPSKRLAKDWECLNQKTRTFLLWASIRLMLRKLCNPS